MSDRKVISNLGLYVYGGAGIFLGVVGLVSGNFAVPWQHVGAHATFREPLAYWTALVEVAAGIAIVVPRTARVGAIVLTVVYSVFTLRWVPAGVVGVFGLKYNAMGNVFEEFAMVVGGLVLCAMLGALGPAFSRREALWAQLFGFCALSFGVVHIFDTMPGLTGWIPKWLPPDPLFWAYLTTVSFFLAGVAILTGVLAPLAARLLTAEIVGFQILVWIPRVVAGPRVHFNWSGNAINLAIAGAAWVVADSMHRAAQRTAAPEAVPVEVGGA